MVASSAPALSGDARRTHTLSLREAQVRLSQLVGLAELTDQVTVIERDGRPVAAVVPAAAARNAEDARSADARMSASAAGWTRRLAELRDQLSRRHRAELTSVTTALGQAWAELDRLSPPGTDREIDQLRMAHRYVVTAPDRAADG